MGPIRLRLFSLIILLLASQAAGAATVTTNEIGMDAIFSQPSFGATPIDIRFNTTVTISAGGLLTISDATDLASLFALSPSASPVVNMFFVDNVNFCNLPDPTPTITGCATINGNDIVVESAVAAGPSGAILNSHELAHNLSLSHTPECANTNNLMDCMLVSDILTMTQVATIMASPLVQFDAATQMHFIEITPILITPIPPAILLFASAIALLGWRKRAAVASTG